MLKKLAAIALCLTLGGCWPPFPPKPTPTPTPAPTVEPTPVPTPEPTPEPPPGSVCAEGQNCGCWHLPPGNSWLYACCVPSAPGGVVNVAGGPAQCPPDPTPTPTPTPTPPPSGSCTVDLTGQRNMGVYWYSPWKECYGARCVADATPRITNAERCTAVGYPGRLTCPVVPDDHPQRGVCEVALMGGPNPLWELEVDSGDLRLSTDPWKATVTGSGKGRLRACYPNGQACSIWLEVNK